jgi:hypothetical protein
VYNNDLTLRLYCTPTRINIKLVLRGFILSADADDLPAGEQGYGPAASVGLMRRRAFDGGGYDVMRRRPVARLRFLVEQFYNNLGGFGGGDARRCLSLLVGLGCTPYVTSFLPSLSSYEEASF